MFNKNNIKFVLSVLLCITTTLTIVFFMMLFLSGFLFKRTVSEFAVFISGGSFYYTFLGTLKKILTLSAPLLCCGLSIILPYKSGMFNIGVVNQFIFASFGALIFAIRYKLYYSSIFIGSLFGMLIALVPAILKIYFNVNEVISGILLNFIVLNLVNYIYKIFFMDVIDVGSGFKTYKILNFLPGSTPDSNFSYVFIIAILIALLIYFFLEKTTAGFSIKISGINCDAAKYVGINIKKNIFLTMSLAGFLAGIGASFYYLSGIEEWNIVSNSLPQFPFNSIVAAILSQMNILGLFITSLILSLFQTGSFAISQSVFPKEIGSMVISIIIYAMIFNKEIMRLFDDKNSNDIKNNNDDKNNNDKNNNMNNIDIESNKNKIINKNNRSIKSKNKNREVKK